MGKICFFLLIFVVAGCMVNDPDYKPRSREAIIASEKITVFTPTPGAQKSKDTRR